MPAWTGRTIASPGDAARILADINAQGLTRANTTALAEAVRPADVELGPDASKLLPVDPQIAPLLPWPGLRRGATIAAVGSTSLLLMLLAGAMRDGSYAAVVGHPHLGLLSALQDHGIAGERLALVPNPGPDWPTVVGALMDGVDLVAVGAQPGVSDGTMRSLKARARERGCVLIPTAAWPGADLVLQVTARRWDGLRQGGGRLRQQHLEVTATGRGRAARPTTAHITLGRPKPAGNLPPLDLQTYAHDTPVTGSAQNGAQNPAGSVPENRRPAPGQEIDLWSNLTPNEPEDLWAPLAKKLPKIERKRR